LTGDSPFFLLNEFLNVFKEQITTLLSGDGLFYVCIGLLVFLGIPSLILPKQKDATQVSVKNTCRGLFVMTLLLFLFVVFWRSSQIFLDYGASRFNMSATVFTLTVSSFVFGFFPAVFLITSRFCSKVPNQNSRLNRRQLFTATGFILMLFTIGEIIFWIFIVFAPFVFFFFFDKTLLHELIVSIAAILSWLLMLVNMMYRVARFERTIRQGFYEDFYLRYITQHAIREYDNFVISIESVDDEQELRNLLKGNSLYLYKQAVLHRIQLVEMNRYIGENISQTKQALKSIEVKNNLKN